MVFQTAESIKSGRSCISEIDLRKNLLSCICLAEMMRMVRVACAKIFHFAYSLERLKYCSWFYQLLFV